MLAGQHRLAGPEHHEGADGRPGLPPGAGATRSTRTKIVSGVYGRIVSAANPTGLLPAWDEYVDKAVVDELGFSYDPAKAKSHAGRGRLQGHQRRRLRREHRTAPRSSSTLIVPNGWTDWMESIRVIAESAKAAGIKVNAEFPDYAALVDARNKGDFDMVINNEKQLSQLALGVLRLHVPAARPGHPEHGQLRPLREQEGLGPGPAARHARRWTTPPACKTITSAAPADPADRPAGDPALVQRPVVAGQQHRLDQLAVGQGGRQPATCP